MVSAPDAQKYPRFLFKYNKGQPMELPSLVLTIYGSMLSPVDMEDKLSELIIKMPA